EVFSISKVGSVAGCYVTDGSFSRDTQVRVMRENAVVHTGKIESLRRFKNDVSEVKQGFECGVVLQGYSDLKQGDILEGFGLERVDAVLGVYVY
ncbi:MAG: translation initiation factor IF-2, partial [Bryobacteraceae bacterium]|nr:translation initiation factor IF-2 [Bryobacteraceae bacterium]